MKQVLLLASLVIALVSQAQVFDWAIGMGSFVQDEGKAIAVDASGNVYTTGTFRFTSDFDPGTDTFELTAVGGSDIFVQKLDPAGNLIWAKQMGGNPFDVARAITVDASGSVYVAGNFSDTADFNPDSATVFNLVSNGGDDVFVVKLTTNGDFVWAKHMGGSTTDEAHAVAVDAAGNVFLGGRFQGIADFNPNGGVDNLTANGGGDDFFVCKLDASGNFVWAKSTGASGNDHCIGIALDGSGNLFATGYFAGATDFDPDGGTTTLPHNGAIEIYIVKYSSAGVFAWAKAFGSTGYDVGYDVVADASGNVYATGRFEGTVDFDPGNGTTDLISAGDQDIYVCKLDASGNFEWAKSMGSNLPEWGQSIALDNVGGLYFTGFFRNSVDFDPSGNTNSLTSAGGEDIFVGKFDVNGNYVWAQAMGGTDSQFEDRGESIAVDGSGNVYTTGWFYDSADFDPTADTVIIASQGSFDIFVHKISQPGNSISETEPNFKIELYPNPTNGLTTIDLPKTELYVQLSIYNAVGQSVFANSYTNTNRINLDLDLSKGMYFLKLTTGNGKNACGKLLKD